MRSRASPCGEVGMSAARLITHWGSYFITSNFLAGRKKLPLCLTQHSGDPTLRMLRRLAMLSPLLAGGGARAVVNTPRMPIAATGALLLTGILSSRLAGMSASAASPASLHGLSGRTMSGATVPLAFAGKPVVMVNVASR